MLLYLFLAFQELNSYVYFLSKSLQDASIGDMSIMSTKHLNSEEYNS